MVLIITCVKPLVENRKISVGNGYIIIQERFKKPVKLFLSDSLYQIVMKDDDVRSFRLKSGLNRYQISPTGYKDGDKMAEEILGYMKKKKIVVEMV